MNIKEVEKALSEAAWRSARKQFAQCHDILSALEASLSGDLFTLGRATSIAHTGAAPASLEPVKRRQTHVVRLPGESTGWGIEPPLRNDGLTEDELDAMEQQDQEQRLLMNEATAQWERTAGRFDPA